MHFQDELMATLRYVHVSPMLTAYVLCWWPICRQQCG